MQFKSILLPIALLAFTFSSCIVTSDDDDAVEPAPTYTLKLSIDRMIAHLTCEGPNGTEQLADIYTKLWLSEGISFPPTIAEQDYTLVQLGLGGQTSDTGLGIEVEVDFEDQTKFTATFDTYENDPGGVRDISMLFGKAVQFDAERECWTLNGDCINGSTEFPHEFSLPFVSRMEDNRCDIEYHWTFELVAE